MLRAVSIVTVFLGCTLMGIRVSAGLKKRRDTLRELLNSLKKLSIRMEYKMEPLYALVNNCKSASTDVFFTAFLQELKYVDNVGLAWDKAMDYAQKNDGGFCALQDDEIRALSVFAKDLGNSGYSAQKKNIAHLEISLEKILQEAEENYLKKGRMYKSIGLLTGMAMALLLL